MILLLWIPIICAIVIPLILVKKGKADEDSDGACGSFVAGIMIGIVLLVVCIAAPIAHGAQLAKLTAFHEVNNSNYGVAVDETASYLSQEDFEEHLITGSLEKIGLASFISERIAEWRDGVNTYNLELAVYQYFDTHPLLGVLYPNVPDHIKMLVIK